MAKMQLESKHQMPTKKQKHIVYLDLRQAERQGPLSKQFGMLIST